MKIALLDVNNPTLLTAFGSVSVLVYAEPKRNLKTVSLAFGIELRNPSKVCIRKNQPIPNQ
jgi:hypothetical protein